VYITFNSPTTWTGTFSARGALIYNSSSSNYSVCVLDFGSVKTIAAQTLTVTLPDNTATTALIRFE
jgi:O-acetylhomoserine/O-acetylserine sulfhydrylase-like pyridoxal-dependent enzyme